jgi:hypothetical protein
VRALLGAVDVKVFYVEGMGLDKFAARLHLLAHQQGEEVLGLYSIV